MAAVAQQLPSDAEGVANICRCTGYGAILRGLEALAKEGP